MRVGRDCGCRMIARFTGYVFPPIAISSGETQAEASLAAKEAMI